MPQFQHLGSLVLPADITFPAFIMVDIKANKKHLMYCMPFFLAMHLLTNAQYVVLRLEFAVPTSSTFGTWNHEIFLGRENHGSLSDPNY